MTDKTFIDTNIFVYAHDVSAAVKHQTAKGLVLHLWENKTGCLSIQVMQEFYASVTQKVPEPLDSMTVTGILRHLSYWQVQRTRI